MKFDIRESAASSRPLIAAHRGAPGGNIPCNTMEAFKSALIKGADIIELDISKSIDGELFVFHPGMEKPHLGSRRPIALMKADRVKKLHFVNPDSAGTIYGVSTFDDVLEFLKDKCYINVDKFWTAIPEITAAVRRHGMESQVLVKTDASKKYFEQVKAVAPDLPYIVMAKEKDTVSDMLKNYGVNYVGVESIFSEESMEVGTAEYIERMHKKDLLVWGNAIVYNKRDVIGAGHTDDISVTGEPDNGWGWLIDNGFDMIQTDWCSELRDYIDKRK